MSALALRSVAPRISRRAAGVLSWVLVLALVVVWAVELRPQVLGGPTAIVVVAGTSMQPKLKTGDLVVVHRRDAYRVGDVIAYRVPKGNTGAGSVVIHRIVGGSGEQGFVLRGDNRKTDDMWRPKHGDVVGSQWVALPTHGRVLRIIASPFGFATLAAVFVFIFVAMGGAGGAESRPRPRD